MKELNFTEIAKEIGNTAKENGFWDPLDPTIGTKVTALALITTEVAEAIEGIRKGEDHLSDHHVPKYTNIEVELADIIIRCIDYAERWDLNLMEAIKAKMEYNKTRSFKHGKLF